MRLFLALLVALVGCGSPSAKIPPPPVVQEPEPDIPDDDAAKRLADEACPRVTVPYFYRIARAGKTSHLLGTRHLSVALEKLPSFVRNHIERAQLVVFETAPGDDSEAEPVSGWDETIPLEHQVGAALWRRFQALVGDELAALVAGGRPEQALLAIMLLYEYKGARLDVEIEELARERGIATAGLESSSFQGRLLRELLDLRLLKATIQTTPSRRELRREARRDLAEYCAGSDEDPGTDPSARQQMRAAGYSDSEIDAVDRKLLDERNDAWMPQLETLLATDRVVVVVGADHVIGKRGLVAQLVARGFQVSRVVR